LIISASRRTDIPAFYSEWLFNRIKAGYALVKNPLNLKHVFKVGLEPDDVDAVVFWTKNPGPMLPHLNKLEGYNYCFLFTITPYDSEFERGVPDKKIIIDTFKKLSDIIGPEKVIWRYDPVIFTQRFSSRYHADAFSMLASELQGYTEKCIFSYMTFYDKCLKNMREIEYSAPENDEKNNLALIMAQSALDHNIKLQSCADLNEYIHENIAKGGCVDSDLISKISGKKICAASDKNQRPGCLCSASRDIGIYNSCVHGCVYCYANYSFMAAQNIRKKYDPESELLCDILTGDEKIFTGKGKPGKEKTSSGLQGTLF